MIGGKGGSNGSGTTNDDSDTDDGDTTGDTANTIDPSDLLAGVDLCDIKDNGDGTSTVDCLGDVSFLVENEPVAATVLRTTTVLPGADCPSAANRSGQRRKRKRQT